MDGCEVHLSRMYAHAYTNAPKHWPHQVHNKLKSPYISSCSNCCTFQLLSVPAWLLCPVYMRIANVKTDICIHSAACRSQLRVFNGHSHRDVLYTDPCISCSYPAHKSGVCMYVCHSQPGKLLTKPSVRPIQPTSRHTRCPTCHLPPSPSPSSAP